MPTQSILHSVRVAPSSSSIASSPEGLQSYYATSVVATDLMYIRSFQDIVDVASSKAKPKTITITTTCGKLVKFLCKQGRVCSDCIDNCHGMFDVTNRWDFACCDIYREGRRPAQGLAHDGVQCSGEPPVAGGTGGSPSESPAAHILCAVSERGVRAVGVGQQHKLYSARH